MIHGGTRYVMGSYDWRKEYDRWAAERAAKREKLHMELPEQIRDDLNRPVDDTDFDKPRKKKTVKK